MTMITFCAKAARSQLALAPIRAPPTSIANALPVSTSEMILSISARSRVRSIRSTVFNGRIDIEKINDPFLYKLRGTPEEYKGGLERTIANGWLWRHESGTFVKFTEVGAALLLSFTAKSTPMTESGLPSLPHN